MKYQIYIILSLLLLLLLSGCSEVYVNDGIIRTSTGQPIFISSENTIVTNTLLNEIARGSFGDNAFLIHKFGRNQLVGTTLVPVTTSGVWRTPKTAVTLEAISSSDFDNITGIGARTLTVECLNSTWDIAYYTISMNGLNAGNSTGLCIRLLSAYVNSSGTYSNEINSSQKGIITLRETGGGQIWGNIDIANTDYGTGQSQIGEYTIPRGYTGYLLSKDMTVDSVKVANLYFFKREGANIITAPYKPLRLVEQHDGIVGAFSIPSRSVIAKFPEMTDIGFMSKTDVGTASVAVDFELLLIKN